MLKVKPHPDYAPEEGRYLRGNDFSPALLHSRGKHALKVFMHESESSDTGQSK